ncbi:hypothetical protein [Caenibacillus caldisaponilyticus]|uniref:hypothetical protein n=1 Tax=Caenibacillus caldisaponilyticus TaxID=1674942 RepID=UPI0009887EE5|nr:hypothetical protein [Caenibacillus caldisaponilyticus]
MAYILLPISLFIKHVIGISVSSISYLSEIPIYVYMFIILFALIIGVKINIKQWFSIRVAICIFIVLCCQIIAMMLSHAEIGNNIFNRDPIKEFIKLIIFMACIFLHYITVKITVNNEKSILRFIRGNGIALIILLMITYLQFLYLLFPNLFSGIVEFIGRHFENRYDRDWYIAGSYVQTSHRINGLNPESDYLAIQLLVIFVPFILASIKNKVNIFSIKSKYKGVFFYTVLLFITVILFFAKTTTGIMSIILIIMFFWMGLPIKRKITSASVLLILGFVVYFILINNSFMMEILDKYLFNKAESDSLMNRIGGTIGLIITWLKHFIIGIGWNFQNYYLFKNVPIWTTYNAEYQYVFLPQNYYPVLSVLFGLFAQFGSICVILIFVYVYNLLKDFRMISKKAKLIGLNKNECQIIDAIKDSAYFFFIFYLISSLFIFYWYESIYLIMFFFFVVVRQYFKKKLSRY